MLTTAPPPPRSISGTAACVPGKGPSRLVASTARHSSKPVSCSGEDGDAGVDDQRIQPAEAGVHRRHGLRHLLGVAHVGRQRQHPIGR